jgi:integrase/recombinase XerD
MTLIDDYIKGMNANGLSVSTVKTQACLLKRLDDYKSLKSMTKDDLIDYFQKLKSECAPSSFSLHQGVIKKFFNSIGKKELVEWIKVIKIKETLKSEDILTTDDVNAMLESTDNHYWKAYIAFLFETGCRYSEAHSLKYKDFVETDGGMIVNINTTKTGAGFRKMILPFSSQYIRNLKIYANGEDEDMVFNLQPWQTNEKLHEIAKKAGITKPISSHKFRHSQATTMVQLGYNEAIIRKKLGWSPNSTMISRYQHLNDDDVINATLQNQGKLPVTAVRVELKEAKKLSLVDAAMQFSKLSEENKTLKQNLDMVMKELGIDPEKNNAKIEFEKLRKLHEEKYALKIDLDKN